MSLWERLTRWEERHRFAVDATGTALFALVAVPASQSLAMTDPFAGTSVQRWATFCVIAPSRGAGYAPSARSWPSTRSRWPTSCWATRSSSPPTWRC
ncbi:hypothetical protein [Cellulomonas soli]